MALRTFRSAKALWLVVALSIAAVPGYTAQPGRPAASAKAPERNVARAGTFGVLQIATTDPQRLFVEWAKPTPGVAVTTATRVRRNQPIVTFIIFQGCKPDASGNCKVTADFEVTAPNGRLYHKAKGAEVWVGRKAPPKGALQLSVGGLGLKVEDKDPLGPYRVRATVTDHVAAVVLRTEQTLTAVAD